LGRPLFWTAFFKLAGRCQDDALHGRCDLDHVFVMVKDQEWDRHESSPNFQLETDGSSFLPHDANEHNQNQNDCDSCQHFPNEHV
jgi:hypothetical protein